jgi:VanZ family protein
VFLLRVLPPLGWTALIAWLSTTDWSAAETRAFLLPALEHLLPWAAPEQLEAMHWLARKSAHAVEYGVLAALWRWALASRETARGWLAPLGLSVLTATMDEVHQATTLTRTGSPLDVLLDSAGAGAALIVLGGGAQVAARWLTSALLWFAAAGGTALIALNWVARAPSGWLWWSVPAAWIALAVWLLRRRLG